MKFPLIRGFRQILCTAVAAVAMALPTLAAARPVMIGPSNPGAENGPDEWWRGTSGKSYLSVDNTDPASGDNDFTLGNGAVDGDNAADWRSVIFSLGPAAKGASPITFSFAYKLPDPVKAGDNIRVQLRFFDKVTNFVGQREFWLGSKSRDSAMAGYKTVTVGDIWTPPKARVADIRVSVNLYGDRWSSGTGRFDDFSVTTVSRLGRTLFKFFAGLGIVLIIITIAVVKSQRKNRGNVSYDPYRKR